MAARVVPSWLRSYEPPWLRADAIAGVVIWSVVTPPGGGLRADRRLPPAAGLMAAPRAMLAYALMGTSRQLVVGATTATAGVSAAAVGTLADGDAARFAVLSLALVTGVVFLAAGVFKLGAIADFISKPVMTGFVFGLGLVIALGQLPSLLGVKAGEGNFFPLAPLFQDLPKATLAAIVIVAVSGFFDVAELRRYAYVRRTAIVISLVALAGVLALGVLPGLVITAGLSLLYVIQRLSRPSVEALARDPASGAWGRADRHDGWQAADGMVVARSDGPPLYPNANVVKDHLFALAADADPRPRALVLDLSTSTDLDVQTADTLEELRQQLARDGIELRLAGSARPRGRSSTARASANGCRSRRRSTTLSRTSRAPSPPPCAPPRRRTRGVALAIARDVGQVRDVLRQTDAGGVLMTVHPTVQDAVDALLSADVSAR